MSHPVVTPRRTFATLTEFAQFLGCSPHNLYYYVERDGTVYRLKPLDEARYQRWHQHCYTPRRRWRER